eukprot:TRINITY_DN27244_c0_g1_i3.p1 TRINITY_DN27244_c0_g1~~TRINITY_DN27244_c0_g1_i3.p1  ORF type:complete len:108 (-),score=33.85 TRINITY_DN27244_c0_g1_i3:51-374(-)
MLDNSLDSAKRFSSSSRNYVFNKRNLRGDVLDARNNIDKAAKLMADRWEAAMHAYNDPSVDVSEKPTVYSSGGGSVWGSSKLAYQPSVMDFLGELEQAIQRFNRVCP